MAGLFPSLSLSVLINCDRSFAGLMVACQLAKCFDLVSPRPLLTRKSEVIHLHHAPTINTQTYWATPLDSLLFFIPCLYFLWSQQTICNSIMCGRKVIVINNVDCAVRGPTPIILLFFFFCFFNSSSAEEVARNIWSQHFCRRFGDWFLGFQCSVYGFIDESTQIYDGILFYFQVFNEWLTIVCGEFVGEAYKKNLF